MSDAPVRVLHLRSSCGLYGAEQVILNLAKYQPKLGVEPLVVDFRPHRAGEGAFLQAVKERGGEAIPLYCRGRFDQVAVRTLRDLALSRRIDVFHGHDYKANFYGRLALRCLPVPLVATNHGYDRRGLKLVFYQWLDTYFLRRMDAIIAVAGPVADAMVRRGIPRDRIVIVRNGLDPDAFGATRLSSGEERGLRESIGIPECRRVIGTVGRLEPPKGYDLLLAAFARLLARDPGLHLVVVGEGSLRGELVEHAQRLRLTDHVSFTGARADVAQLLCVFSLFVSSSRSEGMPMAVLEAAAAGLPIVATDVGDVPSLVENGVTGKLVPSDDTEALATAIAQLLEDAALARRLGVRARARLEERFSAREAARRTTEVYLRAASDLRGDAARFAAPQLKTRR